MKIKVIIGGRPYPITVNGQEEEELVRQAGERINNKLEELKEHYEGDQQDFLAMTALIFATQALKEQRQTQNQSEDVEEQLEAIEAKLKSLGQ